MGRGRRRGKIGWDIYNPKKFRAEKKQASIKWIKATGCLVILLSPVLLVLIVISVIEKSCGITISPKQKQVTTSTPR
jgi:hypothetical protein